VRKPKEIDPASLAGSPEFTLTSGRTLNSTTLRSHSQRTVDRSFAGCFKQPYVLVDFVIRRADGGAQLAFNVIGSGAADFFLRMFDT
jgi:hypothetical protein